MSWEEKNAETMSQIRALWRCFLFHTHNLQTSKLSYQRSTSSSSHSFLSSVFDLRQSQNNSLEVNIELPILPLCPLQHASERLSSCLEDQLQRRCSLLLHALLGFISLPCLIVSLVCSKSQQHLDVCSKSSYEGIETETEIDARWTD